MRSVVAMVASLGALLVLAVPAVASDGPVRLWSVGKVEHGTGTVPVTDGARAGGELFERVRTGRVVFNLPLPSPYWENLPRDSAFGSLFSSADGGQYSVLSQAPTPNPIRIGAPTGTITHLDEYQAYVKRADDASLRVTISGVLLQNVDDDNHAAAWECCEPIRSVVRVHARAYAASAGGDFFAAGGVAYLTGHQHSWRPGAATSADSVRPLWGEDQFDVDGDRDSSGTGASAVMSLKGPRSVRIPLGSIRPGELFAVHVSLEAEAVNDRGGESAAQAAVQDPLKREPLFVAHGLERRGKPRFKEPRAAVPRPARCARRPRHAGVMQLSARALSVNEAERAPMVLVRRTGGSHGSASVTVSARAGTAAAGHDFKATRTTVRFAAGETGARLVEIPLREDTQAEPAETFAVTLGHAKCGGLGARRRATVTIVDDDQLSPPPPVEFTVGGTVDGLLGSGLVLTDLGRELPVTADGHFTIPGTRPPGTGYDVEVKTQPRSPDQVCTVEHGSGTIAGDVTGVAVHCATTPPLAGILRVSTPVGGGHGEAVVIQPGGGIVTAGWRGTDFALTRHDDSGTLDQSFGDHGIATSDLGGDDEAYDAALTPDGGIVAVGRTSGTGGTDFGVARFGPDGEPGQIVRTDVLGGGDQANAVAVQPDGKVVVAGFATRNGIDGDLALVRYDADGTRDHDFGTDGIVTTDLGTRSDDARALVLRPDGQIVVAGTAGEDLALARYSDRGALLGSTITDLGSDDVANGVALTPDGAIVVAGYTLGPHVNRDFLLARYSAAGIFDRSVTTDIGGGDDYAENLVVDRDGRIALVGRATSATILDMALVRYTPDLTPDASFDGDGILTADFHGRGEFGQDVTVDGSGRLVAAGYTADGADTEFALLRVTG